MTETLSVDDLTLTVRRSPRRRTLALTVERDGALTIAAPPAVDAGQLADFVREKRLWLYARLAEKAQRRAPVAGKAFVSGEGFHYLGRSYRLLLVDEQPVPLELKAGRFRLKRSLAPHGREHFVRWYGEHARPWLRQRATRWAGRIGVEPQAITVRDLGYRWGSCGRAGGLNFHWAAILLPVSVVDYVIVHELVHLLEPNHTPGFWRRVARALPEYEQHKTWLAEHGGQHVAL